MRTLSPERWQIISPYLDQALAMTGDAQAAWLSSLRKQDPELAAELTALLGEHRMLVEEGFLEKGSPGWSSPPTWTGPGSPGPA